MCACEKGFDMQNHWQICGKITDCLDNYYQVVLAFEMQVFQLKEELQRLRASAHSMLRIDGKIRSNRR